MAESEEFYKGSYSQMTDRPGKPWRGRMYYFEDGKRKWITKVFPKTVRVKADASAAFNAWKQELENMRRTPDADTIVGDYARKYLISLETGATVEPSTIKDYMKSVRKIESYFSNVTLRQLTSKKIIAWRDYMINDEGLSPVTVTKHLRFLNMVCRYAVNVEDLVRNPCGAAKPPKKRKQTPTNLDMTEVWRLSSILDESEPGSLETAAYLALYAGLRGGEVCGLAWSDVDLSGPTISVRHAVGTANTGTYLKEPKNDSSKRTIPIPPQLVAALKRRREFMRDEWAAWRQSIGVPATEATFRDLFVVGNVRGDYKNPTALSHEWGEFASENKISDSKGGISTFHNLRHTYASVLIAQGYDAVQVAKWMGHAKPSMTLDVYAAAFEARSNQAAKTVGANIGRAFAELQPDEVVAFNMVSNE